MNGAPARFHVSGLDADTVYHWRVTTGSDEITGRCRTFPTQGRPSSVRIVGGSCAQTDSEASTFDRMRDQDAHVFIHMGDLHYLDIESSDVDEHRQGIRDVLASSTQSEFYRHTPIAYVHDDHEWGPHDTDGTEDGRDEFLQAYREMVPHYPLPETDTPNKQPAHA